MSPLDQALADLQENPKDAEKKKAYYSLFLNTTFFIPTYDEKTSAVAKEETENILPLILNADDIHYMLLFDSEERATSWAKESIHCLVLPGHLVVEMASPELHLGLNVGTDLQKIFVPDEIAWLKEAVSNTKAAMKEQGDEPS